MHLVEIVLPVFLLIALGYGLRRAGLLSGPVSAGMTATIFYVAAPALLLRSIALTPLTESLALPTLGVLASVTIVMAVAVYVACWRCPPRRRGVLTQGTHRSNMVFMGMPVIASAYGEQVLATVSMMIGFMVVLYNLLAVVVLTLPHRSQGFRQPAVWGRTLARILTNPLILSCAAGIALSGGSVRLPAFLDDTLRLLGQIAMPGALLTVGADLDFRRLQGDLAAAAGVALLKLLVYPALVLLALRALGLQGTALGVPVLIMASPTAVVSYIMAQEMQGDGKLAGAIIIGTTSASLLTYILWLAILRI
jgi:predicted permease